MIRICNIFLLLLLTFPVSAQSKLEKLKVENVREGKKLYRSEMASWYGTDLFLAKYSDRQNIGGYFSYISKSDKPTCIFYSKGENPKVIGTIVFDDTFNIESANYNLLERELSNEELDYYVLRTEAQKQIQSDTIFKYYKNTKFNLIPIISENEKKVYVLTGYNGAEKIVVYGNDYLISFDKKSKVKKVKSLHVSYLPFEYGNSEKTFVSAMHNHQK